MAKLPQDFTDLLIELCETNAEFLRVGGWAVILYLTARGQPPVPAEP